MNGPGETPDSTSSEHQQHPCGITSFFPIGMSCRGRAEAFARRLQSKLRTLGSQDDEDDDDDALQPPATNGEASETTWLPQSESASSVTNLQPLRLPSEAADAFFDFDLDDHGVGDDDDDDDEPESPGSPIDECEYTRLIETAATTPQEPTAPMSTDVESGYACSSPGSTGTGSDDSNKSSAESQYYDPPTDNTDSKLSTSLYYDCFDGKTITELFQERYLNGHATNVESDTSDSLPPSQSTDSNLTFTALSSTSCSTLQDVEAELAGPEEEVVVMDEDVVDEVVTVPSEKKEEEETQAVDEKPRIGRLPSIVETDEELEEERPQRLRRSSSLKSGKTPPGTPGRKKFVRFADVFGLDLADVKTFLDNEVPKIPKYAYEDLNYKVEPEIQIKFGPPVEKVLLPVFQQPGGLPNFLDKVREKQVSLENAAVTDPINMTITGTVRVRNLDFHKSVYIRYTLDSWKSYSDLQANYVDGSCDGFSDTFSFTLFGNSLQMGQRLELAIRFHCRGQQFWDSNYESNYCFQCLPANQQMKPFITEPVEVVPSPTNEFTSGAFY